MSFETDATFVDGSASDAFAKALSTVMAGSGTFDSSLRFVAPVPPLLRVGLLGTWRGWEGNLDCVYGRLRVSKLELQASVAPLLPRVGMSVSSRFSVRSSVEESVDDALESW